MTTKLYFLKYYGDYDEVYSANYEFPDGGQTVVALSKEGGYRNSVCPSDPFAFTRDWVNGNGEFRLDFLGTI